MSKQLNVMLLQLNPIVGDIAGNTAKLLQAWRNSHSDDVDLLITSELFITGYAPEDFILKPRILKLVREAIDMITRETATGPAILVGTPWVDDDKIYNAALLIDGGKIFAKTYKHDLPNYGPFDENRLFSSAGLTDVIDWCGVKLGVMLCEDMWHKETSAHLKEQGADLLIALNGSPFYPYKQDKRYALASKRAEETSLPIIYVNQVGGQDELLYEGSSFVIDSEGEVSAQLKTWQEDTEIINFVHIDNVLSPKKTRIEKIPLDEGTIYQAIMLGIKDYVTKNGFSKVIIGLSGGIDSALVTTLAVDALGAENVQTVMMPSPYTSPESKIIASEIAKTLRCRLDDIPIDDAMKCFDQMLMQQFMGCEADVAEENIQARIRGTILMAISNKNGSMLLATGNKSELAVGYATLYGDMCGGYAPIKDLYKTMVYKLARWRNDNKPDNALGPDSTIFSGPLLTKAPSAELSPNQKDTDNLPNYETLDDILRSLIERNLGLADIVMMGHDSNIVRHIYTLLDKSEYKRRQGAPGPKVTRRHLSKDRRYPITNRFYDRWKTQQTD